MIIVINFSHKNQIKIKWKNKKNPAEVVVVVVARIQENIKATD